LHGAVRERSCLTGSSIQVLQTGIQTLAKCFDIGCLLAVVAGTRSKCLSCHPEINGCQHISTCSFSEKKNICCKTCAGHRLIHYRHL